MNCFILQHYNVLTWNYARMCRRLLLCRLNKWVHTLRGDLLYFTSFFRSFLLRWLTIRLFYDISYCIAISQSKILLSFSSKYSVIPYYPALAVYGISFLHLTVVITVTISVILIIWNNFARGFFYAFVMCRNPRFQSALFYGMKSVKLQIKDQ